MLGVQTIVRIFHLLKTILYFKLKFKKIGVRTIVLSPLKIDGGKNIVIGNKVLVAYKTWLASLPLTGKGSSLLEIADGCRIGNYNHIYATQKVILERNVLTADKVYISDNLHSYENIHLPILQQPILQKNEVIIGEGSWVGENSCIIGAKIGKNCVVGANSVVTKDVPDYCVVVGAPARIIKRYCFETQSWRKTDNSGYFVQ